MAAFLKRPLRKRCRILPVGGLGVSPSFLKKSPKIGGYRGLIKTALAALQESSSEVDFKIDITEAR
jgi:hypothetical protein